MERYLPMEERREIIKQYAGNYNTRIFVETGTADGSTTMALIPYFDELYTVEIDPGMAERAKAIFAAEPKVHPFLGDSGVWLFDMVGKLEEAAIFWLDGHYCGGPTRGEVDSPIMAELFAAVLAPKGSVILIDDARIFGGGPEEGLEGYSGYPEIEWVQNKAQSFGYDFELKDDIMRLTPRVQDH